MDSRFSIGIFLLASLWIVFPCIGYTQEKDTIPSMDIGEEELINTTCFPSMEQKPMFVQCKEVQRTMEQFPKLIPAQQRGKPVRYFYRCRIRLN